MERLERPWTRARQRRRKLQRRSAESTLDGRKAHEQPSPPIVFLEAIDFRLAKSMSCVTAMGLGCNEHAPLPAPEHVGHRVRGLPVIERLQRASMMSS
jgi:hypothetical protein